MSIARLLLMDVSFSLFLLLIFIHLLLFLVLYFRPSWKSLKKRCFHPFQQIKKGENLLHQLSLEVPGEVGFNPPPWRSPHCQYKFYPSMVGELITLNRRWGTPLKAPWRQLKRDLYLDLQWQKRAEGIVRETFIHQGLMSVFVLFFAIHFASLNPQGPTLIPQLLAFYTFSFILLIFLTRILEKKALGEGRLFWCGLIHLEIFSRAGLPVQEILVLSRINSFLKGRDQDFKTMRKILQASLESWQKNGRPLGETLKDLRQEYTFIVEQKMGLLLQRLKFLQMGMAFFFILPSFFYVLSCHMNRFLWDP